MIICGGESHFKMGTAFKVHDINQMMFGRESIRCLVVLRGVSSFTIHHSLFGGEEHCFVAMVFFFFWLFIPSLEALKGTKQRMWCERGIQDWELIGLGNRLFFSWKKVEC